jgi:L-2,4-diaminobutyrate transaminase
MERERLAEHAATMGNRLHARLHDAFTAHPHVGDIRSGKGLLAAVELVENRTTKANFHGERKIAGRLRVEMMKRGVVTRTRPAAGANPLPGDMIYFAPPLVIGEADIDRFVDVAREAVDAVLSG